MSQSAPILNLPKCVSYTLLCLVVTHVTLGILNYFDPHNQRILFLSLAFIPARYSSDVLGIPGGDIADITSWITYMLVHDSFEHLLVNSLGVMAFGSAVAFRLGNWGFLLYTLLCGVAGILLHLLIYWDSVTPVIGISAAVSGHIAGAILFVYGAYINDQVYMIRHYPKQVQLVTYSQIFTDNRVLLVVFVWIVVNFAVAYFGVGADGTSTIAWEAHLGGFLFGLLSFKTIDSLTPNKY